MSTAQEFSVDRTGRSTLEGHCIALEVANTELAAQLHEARSQIANLEIALTSARRIAAGIGILMASLKLTYDQAYQLLSMISQRDNRKLRDIAEEVVLTGQLPNPEASACHGRHVRSA